MALDQSTLDKLRRLVGAGNVLTAKEDLIPYAFDGTAALKETPGCVVFAASTEHVSNVLKLANDTGTPVVTRGSGTGLSGGSVPAADCIVLCTVKMEAVLEVDAANLTMTVEPGVTWLELHETLKSLGLRTPFWGPFSGRVATVGGAMSYHAISHGTNNCLSADSLAGMQIVIGNGDVIDTGSKGDLPESSPFFRYYGPDLGGLFLGDSGALGIKTRISLKLVEYPEGFAACSYGFPDFNTLFTAMSEISKTGAISDNHGLDPRKQKTALMEMENTNSLMAAKSVFLSSRNPLDGLLQIMKMGFAGRDFLKKAAFSGHFAAEGINNKDAKIKLALARSIARKYGKEVANSIPVYLHANPFMQLTPILGPNGERWKPTHSVLPFSKVLKHNSDFESLMMEYKDRMNLHHVEMHRMFSFIDRNAFLYEPTFLWNDQQSIYHKKVYPADLEKIPVHKANPEGLQLVNEIKQRLEEISIANGAIHFQIGKDYPYLQTRTKETRTLLHSIKKQLDPKNLINPGALGFDVGSGN